MNKNQSVVNAFLPIKFKASGQARCPFAFSCFPPALRRGVQLTACKDIQNLPNCQGIREIFLNIRKCQWICSLTLHPTQIRHNWLTYRCLTSCRVAPTLHNPSFTLHYCHSQVSVLTLPSILVHSVMRRAVGCHLFGRASVITWQSNQA